MKITRNARAFARPALLAAALGAALAASAADLTYPYGVCAHVTRSEWTPERLQGTMDAACFAGIRYIRSDIDSVRMRRPDGTYDFSVYDDLFRSLDARGIRFLPILYGHRPTKAWLADWKGTPEDLAEYEAYIYSFVSHFGLRLPVVEVWNEANLNAFFTDADPVRYAAILKAAYRGVKRADPRVRVAFTGTAGVPYDWIRAAFAAGATNAFDVMNVHPYSHPRQPEGSLDVQTERLRALMGEFGCADRPIWFTEIGWPTHSISVSHSSILLAGLKTARPEQKTWNVVVADVAVSGEPPDQALAEELLTHLPPGSKARVCTQEETCRRLAAGGVDAVVYPFDETFPSDTIQAVNDFITKGGVFVDFGGIPCYFGRRGTEGAPSHQHGRALPRFPFDYRAWWTPGGYPREGRVFATEAGLAAGVRQEPTGFVAKRYLSPDRAGAGAEWIPLVAGRTTNGVDLVAAAVIRYHGARTGAAVLCTLSHTRGVAGTNTEENQARFTARALGISFAEGVEAYFAYNLRSFEVDPFYSEHHFGLMHADFTPKPAYAAYRAFVRARPVGSRQSTAAWRDSARSLYYPQWTRPDGVRAGMVWTPGAPRHLRMRFVGGTPTFRNLYGRKIAVRELGGGVWLVPVSVAPIYFSGAACAEPNMTP